MEDKIEKARALLSEKEREAYDKYMESGKPKLGAEKASQFFSIFLQGYDCVHIAKSNPGFDLGMIVRARVEYKWDEQRDLYLEQLMSEVRIVAQKSTAEAVKFTSDGMAVFHKLVGDRFRRYLQTGNADDLGPYKEMSFKNYKDMFEMFTTLTGQASISKQEIVGEVHHTHSMEESEKEIEGKVSRSLDAEATLDMLASRKKE